MKWHGRLARVVAVALGPLLLAWPAPAQESWDAIYIGSNKVGHTHVKVASVKDAQGRALMRVQVNVVLSFKRGRDRTNMEMRYGTIETTEGAVLSLDTRTLAGREEIRTHGEVVDGTMNLILDGGGQRREQPTPWGPEVRGPYAAELSLSRQPIKPGESRALKMFIPDLNRVCSTQLRAIEKETVALGGGVKRDLLRVEQSVSDPDGKHLAELDATLWIEDGGQILKSYSALLGGMESYRTTRAAALSPNGSFDLLAATIVKVPRTIPDAGRTRDATYQITIGDGDLAQLFPTDLRQTFTAGASGAGVLVVRTNSPTTGPAAAPGALEDYLRANPLINSEDPRVIEHMKKAVQRATDPWAKAVAIQDWVFRNMRKKNFGTPFASAKEVARNLEGDCSEHGVLTAAMCRAAGVPCRIVVGLVYAPDLGGFGPHLWDEVHVNGRWVAIDATFNQSEVDATHLKMAESSLDGVAPFEVFLPIVKVFNQLKIVPTSIR